MFATPALEPVLAAMAPGFEQRTGDQVVAISDRVGLAAP